MLEFGLHRGYAPLGLQVAVFFTEVTLIRLMFSLNQKRLVTLSPENAGELYSEHSTMMYFPHLVGFMSSGPVIVLRLAREKAIDYWRKIMGPANPETARISHPEWLAFL